MTATAETPTRLTPAQAAAELAAWDAFARRIARKWHDRNPGVDLDDLTGEARLGFVEAAARFDPSRGFAFGTYAGWYGENRAREFCRRELGRGMRTPNPGGQVGIDWFVAPPVASLSAPDGDGRLWAGQLPGRPEGEPRADLDDWWAAALADLPERWRAVVLLRVRGGLDLAEIGRRLGVSRERVRQMFENALGLLRETPGLRERLEAGL